MLPSLVYTFLRPRFPPAAIKETTKSIEENGKLQDKSLYSIFCVGKKVTRRNLVLKMIKWSTKSNLWHLFNLYHYKQWMHIPLFKLTLSCGATLSVNIPQEKEEEKKWISPLPFVYGRWLFSLCRDLGWQERRIFFLIFKENPSSTNCFFEKVACTEKTWFDAHPSWWDYLFQ